MKVFNHGLHIILDLLTCGLWIPVHLILWACAPTVPVGGASSSAAAATTVVFQPPAGQSYQQPAGQQLPAWAIDEARKSLPADAPWGAVESMAWQAVQRGPQAAAPQVASTPVQGNIERATPAPAIDPATAPLELDKPE